jgi:hypothetical protein
VRHRLSSGQAVRILEKIRAARSTLAITKGSTPGSADSFFHRTFHDLIEVAGG